VCLVVLILEILLEIPWRIQYFWTNWISFDGEFFATTLLSRWKLHQILDFLAFSKNSPMA
jgi:hypothetical protein